MKSVNKYNIEGRQIAEDVLLSEGAYGYIYKVHDISTGQVFALKKMFCQVLKQLQMQGQERTAVAQNELNILKKLPKHINIVSFFGGQLARNEQGVTQALMLMEFCSGGSLFDMMAKNPNDRFKENQIMNIIKDIVSGLKAMHSLSPPMAHRDIKIENILSQDGNYKLCDFGSSSMQRVDFSKIDKKDFSLYEEDYEKNTTLMYRPPEMADLFQRYEVTEKVDVWMLGCVIFTLCFFVHPFQECSKLAIVNAAYQFPKQSAYSSKLHDLIRIMLTPNPKLRPSIFDIDQIIYTFQSNQQIQLNPQALEIKNREKVLEKEMEIYQQNADKVKHFDGDIPFDELIKLQQKIKQGSEITQKIPKPLTSNLNKDSQQKKNTNPVNKQDIWGTFGQQSQDQQFQSKANDFGFPSQMSSNSNVQFDTDWGNLQNPTSTYQQQPQSNASVWGFNNSNTNNGGYGITSNGFNDQRQVSQNQIFGIQVQNQSKAVNLLDLDVSQSDNQSKNQQQKIDLTNIIL